MVGPLDRALLVCAAWLHDIGHVADLVSTGFHPIDGADHLTARRMCGLHRAGLVHA